MTQFTESNEVTVSLSQDGSAVNFFADTISYGEWSVDLIDSIPVADIVAVHTEWANWQPVAQSRVAIAFRNELRSVGV